MIFVSVSQQDKEQSMKTRLRGQSSIAAIIAAWISALAWMTNSLAVEIPKPQPVDGKIKWVYDYEDGKRLSKESGKPMFVVFRCER